MSVKDKVERFVKMEDFATNNSFISDTNIIYFAFPIHHWYS